MTRSIPSRRRTRLSHGRRVGVEPLADSAGEGRPGEQSLQDRQQTGLQTDPIAKPRRTASDRSEDDPRDLLGWCARVDRAIDRVEDSAPDGRVITDLAPDDLRLARQMRAGERWLNEDDADSRILELVPERLGKAVQGESRIEPSSPRRSSPRLHR